MSRKTKHLFNQFRPNNYNLSLNINKESLTFTGKVAITGQKVGRPAFRINLHQRDLKITNAKLTKQEKNTNLDIPVSRIYCHKSYDELRIHSNDSIKSGTYTIEIEFSGTISEHMLGIYPSYFTDDDKEQTIIATQFESHYAREVFPCIDEPIAKATFNLTLTTAKGDVVLSNTPIKNQTTDNDQITTTFETTPKMSTYLLAFVTGAMHFVEGKTKSGVSVKSWSAISRPKEHLQYSVDEAVRILDFFADYFGVDYPLAKCDQVALPDFDAGAMENWGLITYREVALLSDPNNPSVSSEQYISLVIAHELSHQWFGNLVTMKWWDDLWLNESFASLMEHIALEAIHPDWHQWENYTATDVLTTTSRDIFLDIQPVGVKVTDPELIDTLFDPGIVYAKGGRLLKMLREYIGEDSFKLGLKNYFKDYAYSNTTRDDLWNSMAKASGKNISALMTPWIEKPGMPVVNVTQTGKQLTINQERFLLDGIDEESTWPIPYLADQPLTNDILTKQKAGNTLLNNQPVILNRFGSGHFFTHYLDEDHRNYLAMQISKRTIPAETRINLLNDSYMLARGGQSSLIDSLNLIKDCSSEDRDDVWTLICRIVASANQLTEGNEQTDANIKNFKTKLASNWYKKLGWEDNPNDDPNAKQLRHTAISMMISGEDNIAVKQAIEIYNQSKDILDINAEMRASILSAVVRHNNSKKDIDDLIKLYPDVSSDLQMDITAGLASTKDADLANKILSQALGENGFVRSQDILRWLGIFLQNRYIRLTAWDFIIKNWPWLEETILKSKSYDYLPTITARFMYSKEWEEKYHQLFEPKLTDKTLEKNIKIGFADISARIQWRERDEQRIINFFKDYSRSL